MEKEELDKAVEIMQDVAKEAGMSQDELLAMVQAIRETMEKIKEKWNTNN